MPPLWQGGLMVLLVLLAYLRVWHAGFIWDDDSYVTDNPTLHSAAGLWQAWFKPNAEPQYYPLVFTSFWLEYHLWGLHPLGYHLDNVLLHAVAALLLGGVLGRLRVPGAWLAAALFALHPVQVESVAWVTERKNVLSTVFYLAAALAYLRYADGMAGDTEPGVRADTGRSTTSRHQPLFYALALVLFIAALLSKTVTCSLPAALLLVFWWKRGRLRVSDVLPLLPFFVIGAGFGWMTAWEEKYHVGAQGTDWALTLGDRCLIAGRALWFYAGKLAWPSPLIFIYPRWQLSTGVWWQWMFPLAAVVVAAALWMFRSRIGRGPLAAVLIFAGTLVPALGFVNVYPMRYSFVADHFQYLASVGLLALAGAGIARLLARLGWWGRPTGRAVCVVLLLLLASLTWRECGKYADLETLWRTTLDQNPGCWLAANNLGTLMLSLPGKQAQAADLFKRAIQAKPDYADAYNNLGNALGAEGKLAAAGEQYERALQLKPNFAGAHINYGVALAMQGRWAEARQHLEKALELAPNNAEAHFNLANILASQRQWAEAIGEYNRALQLKPDYAQAHFNLGNVFAAEGKWPEAIEQFEQTLQLKPDFAAGHNNLGNLLAREGKLAEATAEYARAVELNPKYTEAQFNLGAVLARQGKLAEAKPHFDAALNQANAQGNAALAAAIRSRVELLEASTPPPK